MPPTFEVCIKTARIALQQAASRGLDAGRIAASHGIDPALLTDPFARLPHPVVAALWQDLPALAADPAFGLHAAEAAHGKAIDTVDYALFHCATVGEALSRLCRYQRLLHEGGVSRVEVNGDVARYTQRLDGEPPAPRHLVELIFAMWVLRLQQKSGRRLPLFEVAFTHSLPADTTEHRRIFATKLAFGAPENAITFDATLLSRPMLTPDPVLIAVVDRQIEELLRWLPPRDDFLGALRRELARELTEGAPDLDHLARRMKTSARTLQRRLREAGTTFQAFADEVRRDLTVRRLAEPNVTIAEVAFLSGFSDVSAFHRAFRRWTGSTPAEYRRRAGAARA